MTSIHPFSGMNPAFEGPHLLPGRPKFTKSELQALHRFCLQYRNLARRVSTPTKDQGDIFTAFQKVCYREGVAYADH